MAGDKRTQALGQTFLLTAGAPSLPERFSENCLLWSCYLSRHMRVKAHFLFLSLM